MTELDFVYMWRTLPPLIVLGHREQLTCHECLHHYLIHIVDILSF